jgi:tRNA dimethylallyltransferase
LPIGPSVAIVGPTASGKSDLGVDIARHIRARYPDFHPVIISADSRQVYRGLDLASGKITRREMRGIPHHMIDVASPRRPYSVARYQREVRRLFVSWRTTQSTPVVPIIVGGSGQYVDAILSGATFPPVPPNPVLRRSLEKLPAEELFRRLQRSDPRRAQTIDRANRRRLIRALEIIETIQSPVPELRTYANVHALKLGIALPRMDLRRRIRIRLARRLRAGMIQEIKRLHAAGVSWRRLDELGLECRYIARYVRGLLGKEEMTSQLEQEIFQYAKRQMTWFKRDPQICWFTEIPSPDQWKPLVEAFMRKEDVQGRA